jgi:hypothetical protein
MKGPTACGSCLWEADTCGYKPAVVLDEQTNALEACRAIVKWCDENPPAGEALWCVQLARRAIAAQSAPAAKAGEPTYASSQATNCAQCGEHKHTPLRIDWMGGYVCLTCIDKELEALDPAVVLDDERATFEAEWWKTIWYGDDAMRQIGWWAWQARAASPQATVYSLFSSSDRRNFGHLAPQEFVNAVIDAVRAQATATQPCIAPGCYQWDGTDSCTCQKATAMQPAQTERALTCDSRKRGEYDWLRCCSPRDHTGEHCYVTDYDAQPASGVDHE